MTDMQDRYEAIRLKNQLCFPIYLCAKEMTRRYGTLLKDLGLTYTQYIVMMFFWEKRSTNEKDLGKALLLDPSTLTPILRKLEEKGYLMRTRSESDGRSIILELTEKGDALKDAALTVRDEMCCCVGLDGEEAETLYRLIAKVLANVESK